MYVDPENANFVNCPVSYLTYINERSRCHTSFLPSLIGFAARRCISRPRLYCLSYRSSSLLSTSLRSNSRRVIGRLPSAGGTNAIKTRQPFGDVTSTAFRRQRRRRRRHSSAMYRSDGDANLAIAVADAVK